MSAYLNSVNVAFVNGLFCGRGNENVTLFVHQIVLVARVCLSLRKPGDSAVIVSPAKTLI